LDELIDRSRDPIKSSRISAFCQSAIDSASRGRFSHSIICALIQFVLILASIPHGPLSTRSVPSHGASQRGLARTHDTHARVFLIELRID